MKKFNILALIVSLVFIVSPAVADPPTGDYVDDADTSFIVCDTRDQMNDVIDAIKVGKVLDKMEELKKIIDSNGEPVCMNGPLGPLTFDNNESIGTITDTQQNVQVNFWVSSVHNPKGKFFLLWGEIKK
jgi:hypothetical protein